MYCQSCGQEAKPGKVILPSCRRRLLGVVCGTRWRVLILAILAVGSLGCAAGIIVPLAGALQLGSLAYSGLKVVQLSSGGTVEVRFSKGHAQWTADEKVEIQKLASVAVLPGQDERLSVAFAEALSSKTDLKVTTPHQVGEHSSGALQDVSGLTTAEMETYWRSEAAALGVDAVLEIVPTSPSQYRMNMFSLKKPEQLAPFFLAVAPSNPQLPVLRPGGKFVLRSGTKLPAESEVYGAYANMLAERIAQARVSAREPAEASGE